MMTVEDCLKAAFQALLENDLEKRDHYCKLAENLQKATMRHKDGARSLKVNASIFRMTPQKSLRLTNANAQLQRRRFREDSLRRRSVK